MREEVVATEEADEDEVVDDPLWESFDGTEKASKPHGKAVGVGGHSLTQVEALRVHGVVVELGFHVLPKDVDVQQLELLHLRTARKGSVLAPEGSGTHPRQRQCLRTARKGTASASKAAEHTRQRQCLGHEGSGTHKAKAVSHVDNLRLLIELSVLALGAELEVVRRRATLGALRTARKGTASAT